MASAGPLVVQPRPMRVFIVVAFDLSEPGGISTAVALSVPWATEAMG